VTALQFCDLHMHSTASDGTDPPGALGALAEQAGVSVIALTDHDTTSGLLACAEGCAAAGVEFVPGIEISADPGPVMTDDFQDGMSGVIRRGTLHLLGLFVRDDDPELARISRQMKAARDSRNPAIVARLQSLGLDIAYEEVESLAAKQGTVIIGRPHIGQVMVDKGLVTDMREAFSQFIGQGGSAYVRRDHLDPRIAIEAIHHAGGLAVLAHPVQLHFENDHQLEQIIERLCGLGLDGIESRHSDHRDAHVVQFESLADKLGLMTTGGSDYHGSRKQVKLGQCRVPYAVYQRLRKGA